MVTACPLRNLSDDRARSTYTSSPSRQVLGSQRLTGILRKERVPARRRYGVHPARLSWFPAARCARTKRGRTVRVVTTPNVCAVVARNPRRHPSTSVNRRTEKQAQCVLGSKGALVANY
jgi:hypothetical protein